MRPQVQEVVDRLGARVRALRHSQGLSQDELAARSKCSRRTLMRLEAGRWSPTLELAADIADALGVSLVELLGEPKGRPPPRPALAAVRDRRLAEAAAALSGDGRRKLLAAASVLLDAERWVRSQPRDRRRRRT